MSIKTFGPVDDRSLRQLQRCMTADGEELAEHGVLCADHHPGYSQPIGGAVAYPHHVSPSGVGYDIACGNKAVRTELHADDVETDVPGIMDEIVERISFGVGRKNKTTVDHPVIDEIREAPFEPQRKLLGLAASQLGTVGAGNHYVDLFRDRDDGALWVGVHFGSRGFGHKTASGFLSLASGKGFGDNPSGTGMDDPPVLLDTRTDLGQAYLSAMDLAGHYAYAGRDWVVDEVLSILGTDSDFGVHNHHNFAWQEKHFDVPHWIVRKGCTPAFPGQKGFVGATMGEDSVILEGVDSSASRESMFSTVHGAGRVMSRTEAAGKMKNVYECTDRDCDFRITPKQYHAAASRKTLCPEHPSGRMKKRRRRTREGKVDWDAVRLDLYRHDIELRGGAADEAPEAYKNLQEVLNYHYGTVNVLNVLHPIGVAMAGADTFDPYKD